MAESSGNINNQEKEEKEIYKAHPNSCLRHKLQMQVYHFGDQHHFFFTGIVERIYQNSHRKVY